MTEPVRLGLIGCGRIAERGYLPALRRARGVVLTAVADSVRGRAEALAPDQPAFTDVDALAASGLAEAVIVATRVSSHVDVARVAAARGLPSLVEKPPARGAAEAEELAALQPAPAIGFNRRFEPELAGIRDTLPLDRALDISLRFDVRQAAWASHDAPDHVLLDLGPHLVDLVCWLTRTSIARVRGEVSEQRARVELELAGGRGRGRIACASNRPYVETLEITTGGTRIARRREGGLVRNALAIVRAAPSPLVASLASQLEAFGAAVRGAAPRELARAADGVAALAVVDAAYASAEAGSAWMDVPKAATVRECSPSSSSTP